MICMRCRAKARTLQEALGRLRVNIEIREMDKDKPRWSCISWLCPQCAAALKDFMRGGGADAMRDVPALDHDAGADDPARRDHD